MDELVSLWRLSFNLSFIIQPTSWVNQIFESLLIQSNLFPRMTDSHLFYYLQMTLAL